MHLSIFFANSDETFLNMNMQLVVERSFVLRYPTGTPTPPTRGIQQLVLPGCAASGPSGWVQLAGKLLRQLPGQRTLEVRRFHRLRTRRSIGTTPTRRRCRRCRPETRDGSHQISAISGHRARPRGGAKKTASLQSAESAGQVPGMPLDLYLSMGNYDFNAMSQCDVFRRGHLERIAPSRIGFETIGSTEKTSSRIT